MKKTDSKTKATPAPAPVSAKSAQLQAGFHRWASLLLAAAILVMVNYLSCRYYYRKDVSLSRFYDLSPKTIALLKNLPAPVTLITYMKNAGISREVEGLIKEYQRYAGKNIVVESVDPDLDLARARELATQYKFSSGENLVIFEYQKRSKYLTEAQLVEYDEQGTLLGQAPSIAAFKGESQFTATIQGLVEGKSSKVYYLIGHGEPSLDDESSAAEVGQLAQRIRRENVELLPLNLADKQAIPQDADAVLLISPRTPLTAVEAQAVMDYLNSRKGKLALAVDPGAVSGLETALARYGMKFDNDRVLVRIRVMGVERSLATVLINRFSDQPITRGLAGYNLQMPNMRSLELPKPDAPEAVKVRPLLIAPEGYWGETNLADKNPQPDPASEKTTGLCVAAVYDAGQVPDEKIQLAGTRLVVLGGGGFLANGALDQIGADFFNNALHWLMQKESSIGISPKVPKEFALHLTPTQARAVSGWSVVLGPGLAILLGLFVWFVRRK